MSPFLVQGIVSIFSPRAAYTLQVEATGSSKLLVIVDHSTHVTSWKKIGVFWGMTLCHWASNSRWFKGSYCPHFQGQVVQTEYFLHCLNFGIDSTTIVEDIRKYLPIDVELHLSRLKSLNSGLPNGPLLDIQCRIPSLTLSNCAQLDE